jgi:RNA polymerase sigma-70 factor (ECF subfamily)
MVMVVNTIDEHYRKNFKNLVKRIRFKSGSTEDAEDIVQEAYTRALKYRGTFNPQNDFNLWFSRILSNALKDFIREKYNTQNHRELDEEGGDAVYDTKGSEYLLKLLVEEIDAVIDDKHREVLSLHQLLGFNLRDIVQIVDIKYKTADQLIQRFRKRILEKYNS